jgi:hypothetical protein
MVGFMLITGLHLKRGEWFICLKLFIYWMNLTCDLRICKSKQKWSVLILLILLRSRICNKSRKKRYYVSLNMQYFTWKIWPKLLTRAVCLCLSVFKNCSNPTKNKKNQFSYKDNRARPKNVEAENCLLETCNYRVFANFRTLMLKLVVHVIFFCGLQNSV